MGKLHELLAVEGDLRAKAQQAVKDIKGLFGSNKLVGQSRTYRPYQDQEPQASESQHLATTASDELSRLHGVFGTWMDAAIQKEVTNVLTSASVDTLGLELPAPALLNLESRLAEIRAVYVSIPVNSESEIWNWSEDLGCWASEPRTTYRTQKVPERLVKYEATEEHPAQVDVYMRDAQVGEWTTLIHSGAFSPVQKQKCLDRIDELIGEIKRARQRANCQEARDVHVADKIFHFIHS